MLLNKILYRDAPTREANPFLVYMPFSFTFFRIRSTDELCPFHIPSLKHYFLLATVNALPIKKI